ncbi:MAG: tRNA (adenosine(37)-N6)-threonylcarbamoyltransferase complex transferase subunit TsaD [Geminicoccaceae bacterium]|nr:tRNA (adenosine(37)-N6)-threonylcarbamoyltransferase complex transferase subunit TsaD [Geminicoccaceae bacterium]
MIVLGIETSCDETGVALVSSDRRVLAEQLYSQLDAHAVYGGVVPEIAARAHVERLDLLISAAMNEAGLQFPDLAGIAVTCGPGLIGGLIVGLVTARAIGAATGLPLVAVNHLEAHALTARLTDGIEFPYTLLLVSGGHAQLLEVSGVGRYRRLGSTIDDAVGEAFDKVAKMLGLGYPGGPAVERMARRGDPARFDLPRPLLNRADCNFSFSGLKTACRLAILKEEISEGDDQAIADLCASFQMAVGDCLVDRTRRALARTRTAGSGERRLVVAGGVAANASIGARLRELAAAERVALHVPPARLCTDNGVMIAWAGLERLACGRGDEFPLAARARWPLDPAAEPLAGAGVKA